MEKEAAAASIVIGDYVRSYDFPDFMPGGKYDDAGFSERDMQRRNCYVEGTVEAIMSREDARWDHPEFSDCPRYKIRVHKRVFDGEYIYFGGEGDNPWSAEYVFPPVNGTPRIGGVCHGVVKVQ